MRSEGPSFNSHGREAMGSQKNNILSSEGATQRKYHEANVGPSGLPHLEVFGSKALRPRLLNVAPSALFEKISWTICRIPSGRSTICEGRATGPPKD